MLMPSNKIKYVVKDHIALITLNRPKANNSLSPQMAADLRDVCLQINASPDIYVSIITGSGKTFCCGNDFDHRQAHRMQEMAPVELKRLTEEIGVSTYVAALKCPVIAAVNGDALGQGLELALGCDLRIASRGTSFALPQISQGSIPSDGGTQRLPRVVGKSQALELILSSEAIDADKALEIGLVNKVVDAEELLSCVWEIAVNMVGKAPVSLRFCKEAVNRGADLTLPQGLGLEADRYFLLHSTEDRAEGIKAFLDKRAPKFKGI
jgi:enoyl-CoA hydratase